MYLNQPIFSNSSKEWMDLTVRDILQVGDIRKRIELRKKCEFCLQKIIRPIYMEMVKLKNFAFSVPEQELTCRIMLNELQSSFDNKIEFFKRIKGVTYVSN